jgi:adenosylhomocysteine nucleosidase
VRQGKLLAVHQPLRHGRDRPGHDGKERFRATVAYPRPAMTRPSAGARVQPWTAGPPFVGNIPPVIPRNKERPLPEQPPPQADRTEPTVVVGLRAEARIARGLGWRVVAGGGTAAGAEAAARHLIAEGATALISFGLAGGLDPSLRPGAVIVPAWVRVGCEIHRAHAALMRSLGGPTPHCLLGHDTLAATSAEKARLREITGAHAIDLESGAVAVAAVASGLPFAILRAICDPAERDLPPAALAALDQRGIIGFRRVLASLSRQPNQLPALIALARDAAKARAALVRHVRALQAVRSGG